MLRPARSLLLLLVLVAGYAFLQSPFWRVTEVEVRGATTLTPGEVVEWAGLTGGLQLWQVDPGRVEQRLAQHPRIEGARVTRRWPHTLLIELKEREPVAYLRYHGQWLVLDRDGRVIGLLPELPAGGLRVEADAPADLRVGRQVPAPLLAAVRAAAFVEQYGLTWVEAVTPSPDGQEVDLILAGGVRVRFGPVEERPERKLAVLAALWREWAGRRGELALVDVRDPERPAVRTR